MLDLIVQIVFGILTFLIITLFGTTFNDRTAPGGSTIWTFFLSILLGSVFVALLVRG